jgi:hypothetical protein
MKTKLTLSIDEELVRLAHHQAHKSGKSISEMFAEYLRSRSTKTAHSVTPRIDAMVGSLKSYRIDDSKSSIREAYAKKYTH